MKDRLAPAESVRAALLLVERGETKAGIVYGNRCARFAERWRGGHVPGRSHDPIRYPVAATAHGQTGRRRISLLSCVRSGAGRIQPLRLHSTLTASPGSCCRGSARMSWQVILLTLRVAALAVAGALPVALLLAAMLTIRFPGRFLLNAWYICRWRCRRWSPAGCC